MKVKELIALLEKVENKELNVHVWINSQDPEPVYTGGDRIPIVHVDTLVGGLIDICCEYPEK